VGIFFLFERRKFGGSDAIIDVKARRQTNLATRRQTVMAQQSSKVDEKGDTSAVMAFVADDGDDDGGGGDDDDVIDFRTVAQRTRDLGITSIIIALFMIHPQLTQVTLSMLRCERIGTVTSATFLSIDLTVECWSSFHTMWVLLVGLPMGVMWVIGIPTLAFLVLKRVHNKIRDKDYRTMKIYSFLVKGYEADYYYCKWCFCLHVYTHASIHLPLLLSISCCVFDSCAYKSLTHAMINTQTQQGKSSSF
jgi:hypothetical protein